MTAGDVRTIVKARTSRYWKTDMTQFLRGYAGHPAVLVSATPGDDATADEEIAVSCTATDVQRVVVSWAWFSGAWRAWPNAKLDSAGNVTAYPGCGG